MTNAKIKDLIPSFFEDGPSFRKMNEETKKTCLMLDERRRGMVMTLSQKEEIKRRIVACLSTEKEIRKIVIFGSFLNSPDPHDVDVAVFQESGEAYLPLALKYRRAVRSVADTIPLDIIPIRSSGSSGTFLDEVARGEVVYER